jgi:hypothetical protein
LQPRSAMRRGAPASRPGRIRHGMERACRMGLHARRTTADMIPDPIPGIQSWEKT